MYFFSVFIEIIYIHSIHAGSVFDIYYYCIARKCSSYEASCCPKDAKGYQCQNSNC